MARGYPSAAGAPPYGLYSESDPLGLRIGDPLDGPLFPRATG